MAHPKPDLGELRAPLRYEIPGTTVIRATGIAVKTDGGPWAEHNFPCPICHKESAVLQLDGWVFQPCWDCSGKGWETRRRPPTFMERVRKVLGRRK